MAISTTFLLFHSSPNLLCSRWKSVFYVILITEGFFCFLSLQSFFFFFQKEQRSLQINTELLLGQFPSEYLSGNSDEYS